MGTSSGSRTRSSLVARGAIAALFAAAALAICPVAAGQGSRVLVDGITVLSGGLVGDDSVASPVLRSDVELEARLMLLLSRGPAWSSAAIDEELIARARRRISHVRLMSRQARQIGEVIQPGDKAKLRSSLEKLAGGVDALVRIAESCGADEGDLDIWVEDTLLAAAQLTYLRERLEPPGDEELERIFAEGDHPFAGQPFDEARREFSRYVMEQRVRLELLEWLDSTLQHRKISLVE